MAPSTAAMRPLGVPSCSLAEASLALGSLFSSSPVPLSRRTHLGEQTQLRLRTDTEIFSLPRPGAPWVAALPPYTASIPVPPLPSSALAGFNAPRSHGSWVRGAGGRPGTYRGQHLSLLVGVERPSSPGESTATPASPEPQEPPVYPQPVLQLRCSAEVRCLSRPAASSSPGSQACAEPGNRGTAPGPSCPAGTPLNGSLLLPHLGRTQSKRIFFFRSKWA